MKKYVLKYPSEATPHPLLAQAILETKVAVNILIADVSLTQGTIIIGVPKEEKNVGKLLDFLEKNKVTVEELAGGIKKDDSKCVDCGSCYSVCPTKAITFDKCQMVLDNRECIQCGLCVSACPTRALSKKDF
ncbi:MAG TPA: 4Fe-4S dicluster domain-containing protein [Candidatus Altiarchaeales archaeon]|nr:4Fe-4S dicluster domain-containing protein [Candidatus Altiarchaeales archaeon]